MQRCVPNDILCKECNISICSFLFQVFMVFDFEYILDMFYVKSYIQVEQDEGSED